MVLTPHTTHPQLRSAFCTDARREAGCDEAGRGCLAGPVVAAAVVLPPGYDNPELNDSKQLSESQRRRLRDVVMNDALCYAIASVESNEIDSMNILHAALHAMNKAVQKLTMRPALLLIDGNRFYDETGIPYTCLIKGDATYQSIAAASILAKTWRDEWMCRLHHLYPQYGWDCNKGYPTALHYAAIERYGLTPEHRRSFRLSKETAHAAALCQPHPHKV